MLNVVLICRFDLERQFHESVKKVLFDYIFGHCMFGVQMFTKLHRWLERNKGVMLMWIKFSILDLNDVSVRCFFSCPLNCLVLELLGSILRPLFGPNGTERCRKEEFNLLPD